MKQTTAARRTKAPPPAAPRPADAPPADRPPPLLKVAEAAARLAIDSEGVLALIHGKRLKGIDVSRPGARRPRWRIDPAELERFIRERTSAPAPPKVRRYEPAGDVIEFIK